MAHGSPVSAAYDYDPILLNAATTQATAASPTLGVATRISANIPAGTSAVTPAAMTNIRQYKHLRISDGTHAEIVQVTAITSTTFTAKFLNAYTGPVVVSSIEGSWLGHLTMNLAGSGVTISLYDGNPDDSLANATLIAQYAPAAQGESYPLWCVAKHGLFYTLSGSSIGSYLLTAKDMAAA